MAARRGSQERAGYAPSVVSVTVRHGARLPRSFYERPTLVVARELLGKVLRYGSLAARIVETEAYIGDEPASHARFGRTARTFPMFGRGGFTYVYLIYGTYHCLNVATEREGFGAAVLIRGAEAVDGFGAGARLGGPGLLCRAFGLTTEHTNLDLTRSALSLHDATGPARVAIARSHRIGVTDERPWRFYVRGSPGVSGPATLRV